MRFCTDLDGVVCSNTYGEYEKAEPNEAMIHFLQQLHDNGHYIIVYTARGMGKYNGNIKKVYKKYYKFTKKQLKRWGVKFDELVLGKPEYDLCVDDKGYRFDGNMAKLQSIIDE